MRRRDVIRMLVGATAAWPLAGRAQRRIARIGYLSLASWDTQSFPAFLSGLRALGNVQGENFEIEARFCPDYGPAVCAGERTRGSQGRRHRDLGGRG